MMQDPSHQSTCDEAHNECIHKHIEHEHGASAPVTSTTTPKPSETPQNNLETTLQQFKMQGQTYHPSSTDTVNNNLEDGAFKTLANNSCVGYGGCVCSSTPPTAQRVVQTKLPTFGRPIPEPVKEGNCKRCFCSDVGPNNVRILLAEFVGTGLLMFLGCMGCLGAHTEVPAFMAAFSFGLTVMIIIQMFGHISGAHLNPAVTMVTVLSGMVEAKSAPFYILGQFAGATCGMGGLKMLLPAEYVAQDFVDEATNATMHVPGLCTTSVHAKLSPLQAFGIEVVITFVLIFVCYSIWDRRNAAKQDSVPVRFGLTIAAIGIAAGPLSGASMNTARSFAPALLNNDWEHHWIYWIGPTLGALIAHYVYKFLFAVSAADPSEEEYEEVALKAVNKINANV